MTEVSDLFKILLLNKTSVTFRYDFSMKEWFHVGNSKLKIVTKLIIIGRRVVCPTGFLYWIKIYVWYGSVIVTVNIAQDYYVIITLIILI